jgi:hypothetical protein
MKKPLILFLIAGLAIGLGASTAQAISLDFSPVSQEVILGNQVVVDVMISGLTGGTAPSLGAFDVNVSFDPMILSIAGVTFGDQLDLEGYGSFSGWSSVGLDSIYLFEVSSDSPETLDSMQASEFKLASLTFDSIGVGTSTLMFSDVVLGDSLGITLEDITFDDGSVTVTATTPVPEPATILLLAAGLGWLGFVRRRRILGT